MRGLLVLTAAFVVMSLPALADVSSELAAIDARLDACTNKNPSNNALKQCTYDAGASADKVLNEVYRAALATVTSKGGDAQSADDKEVRTRLVAAERAWIAYKDAECSLRGIDMLGGSGESLVIAGCVYSLTKQRAKELEDLLNSDLRGDN